MPGTPDPDPCSRVTPPDWPPPDAPLPWDEPTQELPVVTGSSAPALARAALSLALGRRGPRPVPLAPADRAPDSPPAPAALPTALPAPAPPPTPAPAPPPAGETSVAAAAPGETLGSAAAPGETLGSAAGPGEAPGAAGHDGPPPVGQPGRRWLVAAGIVAVALVLTGVTVVALSGGGSGARQWGPPAAAAAAHTVTGALDGRTAAAFDVVDGAGTITVRTADLGDGLYRVSTPRDSKGAPRTEERDGRIRLRLDGGADAVDIALSTRVRWDLRVTGGAGRSTIDLSRGRVGGIDLAGGAGRIALTLPEPDGTLTVRMSGGVDSFDVRTAGPAPVRVQVGSGAGTVLLDGRTHRGVAAGRTFTPRSWPDTADRVDLQAVAGLAALTVAPTGG